MIDRIKQQKTLIIQYYILISFVLLVFWRFIWQQLQTEKTILFILIFYLLLFPIVFLHTRKYALHIFLFCLAFITGFYSFYQYSVESHSILNALYFTFQLYILVVSEVFTTDGSSLLQYPFILEIARWSAATYTISTLFIALYRMLEMSILAEIYQLIGKHYVIFGYNENSAELIRDLRLHNKRVILIANKISTEDLEVLEDQKVIVFTTAEHKHHYYTKSALLKAQSIILFHDKDLDNLNELMNIRQYVHQNRRKKQSLKTIIHLKAAKSRELLEQLEDGIKTNGEDFPFDLTVINIYELFAKRLFIQHPIITSQEPNGHLFFVGFGLMGQYIALEAGKQSKLNKGILPTITALDKNVKIAEEKWAQQMNDEEIEVSFKEFDVETMDLVTFLEAQSLPVTHLFICLHEDFLDFTEGIYLSNHFSDLPIYIQFPKDGVLNNWLRLGVTKSNSIYSTGVFKDVLTKDTLLK